MNRLEMVRRLKAVAGRAAADSRPWYRITAAADDDGPARVDVYDEIGGSWFSDGVSASDFVASLAAIPASRELHVHINSPGGDVFDGIAIYNAIAQRPGPVTTVVDGLAASAASFIAQGGKKRVVSPGSMMMIHDASGFCIGNAADMRELADLLDQVSGNLADIYAAHTGRPAAAWRDAMRAETWYKADQAIEAALADQLAERPAPEGATARFDLSVFAKAPAWLRAAAVPHGPMTGTHSHAHPAYGSQGGDATHDHEHSHDGDASHGHSHDTGAEDRGRGQPAQGATGNRASRVLGIESMPVEDKALPVHHTATVDTSWDGPAAVKAMPNDAAVLKYCHAWEDSDGGQDGDAPGGGDDVKGNYKFPHHTGDGKPANLAACRNGLARLSGADIPDGDRAGVKAHLQAHLDDGSKDGDADDRAHAHVDLSRVDLEQLGNSLKGAIK